MSPAPTPAGEVIERLEVLWHKLEDDGMYVRANTAGLAIDIIKAGEAVFEELAKALLESQAARLSVMGELGTFQRSHNGSSRKLEPIEARELEQRLAACLRGVYASRNK